MNDPTRKPALGCAKHDAVLLRKSHLGSVFDVTSSVLVDLTGVIVPVNFGDKWVKPFSRYMTASLCDRRTTPAYAGHHIKPKRHTGLLPKNNAIHQSRNCNDFKSSILQIFRELQLSVPQIFLKVWS